MNEELISQIVSRILSDPCLQQLIQANAGPERNNMPKSEALVLLNYVSDFPGVLSAVKQRWGADFRLRVLPSDQVYIAKPELPVGLTWITAQEALGRSDWQKLILPACSANTLAKAALGIRDNPISEMIGRGISKADSIELVTEYLGLTPQTPPAYRELYEGYLQKLESYGVILSARLGDICASPVKPVQQSQARPAEPTIISEQIKTLFSGETASNRKEIPYLKKFLGDKQAYEFPEESRVLIKHGTVISPLAQDTLKLRRIELCIEKEGRRG